MVESIELLELTFHCAMSDHQAVWEQKKSNILSQLSDAETGTLFQSSLRLKKSRGEILNLDGIGAYIYILDSGYVRFCRITEEGKRLITGFLGPADVFGTIFPVATSDETSDYIEVVREARLIRIESSVFKSVIEKHPQFLMRMIEILEGRKNLLEQRVLSLMSKDVYAQTAEILMLLNDKFGESCETSPELVRDISLTHQEIADLVGIARPTVSKIISDMLKSGMLKKHNQNLCLYDRAGIEQVINQGQKAFTN